MDFQNKTFPNNTSLGKVFHLVDEVRELIDALSIRSPDRNLEYADCIMLIYGAAATDGMSYEDIDKALEEKMKINYSREWTAPDENGVVRHIKKAVKG